MKSRVLAVAVCTLLATLFPAMSPASAADRAQLRATIGAARADNQSTAKVLAGLTSDDARVVRDQLNRMRAAADRASADLSSSTGAPSKALTQQIMTLGAQSRALRQGASADKSALDVLAAVREAALADLRNGLSSGFTAQWDLQQQRWSAAGAHALADRTAALVSVRTLKASAHRPTALKALAAARQGQMPSPVAGLAPIPGGCALPSAVVQDYLPGTGQAGPHLWTSAEGLAHHRAQLARPTPALAAAERATIRQATQLVQAAGTPGTPAAVTKRVLAVGYAWLVTEDRMFGDALRADVTMLLNAAPAEPVEEAKLGLLLATGIDWLRDDADSKAVLERATRVLAVRTIGVLGCALALGETIAVDKLNKSVIIGSGAVMSGLSLSADTSWRPGLAAVVRAGLAGAHDGLALLDADGGTPEGPGYWNFQSVPAAGLLSSIDTSVAAHVVSATPSLRRAGRYALQTAAPASDGAQEATRYSDTEETALRCTLPAWIAGRFGDADATAVALEGQLRLGVELLWWPDKESAAPRDNAVFQSSGVAVVRAGDATAWLLGQPVFTNHTQLDAGGVTVRVNGVDWSLDAGYGIEGPGYSEGRPGGRRWTYPQTQPAWHSTIRTTAATSDLGQVVGQRAPLSLLGDSVRVDLAAVLAGVSAATRTVSLSDRELILVDDVVGARQSLAWSWITQAQVSVDGSVVVLRQGGREARLTFDDLPKGSRITTQSLPKALGFTGTRVQIDLPAATTHRITAHLRW